mmetsp:Transcript_6460/g.9428  ORF Transcript_6460/g.9428 Transcript_6460/m.9428 type:complete len:224 (+) Transcript_6460:311-982(+)
MLHSHSIVSFNLKTDHIRYSCNHSLAKKKSTKDGRAISSNDHFFWPLNQSIARRSRHQHGRSLIIRISKICQSRRRMIRAQRTRRIRFVCSNGMLARVLPEKRDLQLRHSARRILGSIFESWMIAKITSDSTARGSLEHTRDAPTRIATVGGITAPGPLTRIPFHTTARLWHKHFLHLTTRTFNHLFKSSNGQVIDSLTTLILGTNNLTHRIGNLKARKAILQ